jgi:hypothetical protein
VKAITSSTFDYAELDADIESVVRQKTTEIRDRMGRAAQNIIEIGARLIDVKEQLDHGQFGAWLATEFSWSDRSARRMMQVADQFKTANLSEINTAPSALYLLTSESTPPAVRREFVAKVSAGEKVTHKAVVDAAKAATPRRESHVRAAEPRPEQSNGAAVKRQTAQPELDPQDEAGNPIPANLRPVFDNVARFDNALQSLSEIASELNPLMGDANEVKPLPGGEFLAAQRQYLRSHLKNARETLKACRPYAVCPYCKGAKAKCEACRAVGYVPRQIWDEAPKEIKR